MSKPAPHLIIDSDSHISTSPEIWSKYLHPEVMKHPEAPKYWADAGTRFDSVGRVTVPSRWPATVAPKPGSYQTPSAKSRPGATDPDYRVRDVLDPEGFDRSLLMPESAWCSAGIRDTQVRNAMSEGYNNHLHDFARRQPTRLFGIGVLNAADPAHAVREMRRCVKELGFPAVYINNEVYGSRDDGTGALLPDLRRGGEARRARRAARVDQVPDSGLPGQLRHFLERDDLDLEHRRMSVHDAPLEFYRWADTARPQVVEERGVVV